MESAVGVAAVKLCLRDAYGVCTDSTDIGYQVPRVAFHGLFEALGGRRLYRRVNSAMSEKRGYEVLQDTNNSSADFYESQRNGQSLRKK